MLDNFVNKVFFFNDSKINHVKSLDGLRGIAVILVLLSHSSNSGIFFHEYLNFGGVGKSGVYLFFILSAYLLDKQIIEKFTKGKANKEYWINYIFRRFLRIYPLYVIVLITYFLLFKVGFNTHIESIQDLFQHIILFEGKSVFWSIAVEFKYYLISPFIIYICHQYFKWNKYMSSIFILILILISVLYSIKVNLSELNTFRYLSVFLIGTIISILTVKYKVSITKALKTKVLDIIAMISCILLTWFIPYYHNLLFGNQIDAESSKYIFPIGILWSTILVAVIFGVKSFFVTILEYKFLRFFGVISYSAYLLHMLVLAIVNKALVNFPEFSKIYIFLILTITVASISYYMIERPLSKLRLKRN